MQQANSSSPNGEDDEDLLKWRFIKMKDLYMINSPGIIIKRENWLK